MTLLQEGLQNTTPDVAGLLSADFWKDRKSLLSRQRSSRLLHGTRRRKRTLGESCNSHSCPACLSAGIPLRIETFLH